MTSKPNKAAKTVKAEKARSLPVGSILAPRFGRLHHGDLEADRANVWIERRAPANLLHRFIKIANAPDTERAVVAFVKQWGLLQLAKLKLPIFYKPEAMETESTEGYFRFARLLETLLKIGLELSNGHLPDAVDWELARSFLHGDDPLLLDPRGSRWSREKHDRDLATRRSTLPRARREFQGMIGLLTGQSHLRPRFAWSHGAWVIDFDCFHTSTHFASNLPAILTLQLMAALGGQAMRKCRTCPRWFAPHGRQVYCGECGIRAAWRQAKKRQRQSG